MIKLKTIQGKLFFTYSFFILCIIIVFITSFYIYTSGALKKKATETLSQSAIYISTQLDAEYTKMDSLSQKILFSEPLKEIFFSDIYKEINGENFNNQRKFNQLMYSITGPTFPIFQINMFKLNGDCARIGDFNGFLKLDSMTVRDIPYIKETVLKKGKAFITIPHMDNWGTSTKTIISLIRSFSDTFGGNPNAILELQQDYSIFQKIVEQSLTVTPESEKTFHNKVYIFSNEGDLIYPYELSKNPQNISSYWNIAKSANQGDQITSFENTQTNTKELISSVRSSISGWTVVVSESENSMLKPVTSFRNNILLSGIVIILLSLFLSYTVSRSMTIPIKKIHSSVKNLSLRTLQSKIPLQINSGINELEELSLSFSDMCVKLEKSLEELVSSKSHEIQARFLALQAQMNPHFLYNTLATILILAERSGQQDIVKICRDLSTMLRYISSDATSLVILQSELIHTTSYINLMKTKYGENLVFNILVPEDMHNIKIPKLIIQPLVENCMKYGINVEPPWIINLEGEMTDDSWELSVKDNGPGFDPQALYLLMNKLNSLDTVNTIPNLELDGMGLQNIYIRMKLLFAERTVFQLKNLPDRGAQVVIGGLINHREEE